MAWSRNASFHDFVLENGLDLTRESPITFLVGENGSGKSTLLEGLAWALGYGAQGGARSNAYAEGAVGHALGRALALSWRQRVSDGFLRAETFVNFATYGVSHSPCVKAGLECALSPT
jgi:predicted ATPase